MNTIQKAAVPDAALETPALLYKQTRALIEDTKRIRGTNLSRENVCV